MQADYAARFTREMAITEADWLRSLPAACGEWALRLAPGPRAAADASPAADGAAQACGPAGALHLRWHRLPPRRIALLTLDRLSVEFAFDDGIDTAQRHAFMRRFDLYMQRGGG